MVNALLIFLIFGDGLGPNISFSSFTCVSMSGPTKEHCGPLIFSFFFLVEREHAQPLQFNSDVSHVFLSFLAL